MGPVFGLTLTSQFAALIQKAPNGAGPELTDLPNIFANAGGVAMKHGSEIVGGLGVGGSPGGNRDEAYAADGVAAIANELKKAVRGACHVDDRTPKGHHNASRQGLAATGAR